MKKTLVLPKDANDWRQQHLQDAVNICWNRYIEYEAGNLNNDEKWNLYLNAKDDVERVANVLNMSGSTPHGIVGVINRTPTIQPQLKSVSDKIQQLSKDAMTEPVK